MPKSRLSLKILPVAREDLEETIDYISEDSISAAEKLLFKINSALTNLTEYPLIGKTYKETKLPYRGYRYIVVDDYLIFYKIENNSIVVYRIIHGARNYKSIL